MLEVLREEELQEGAWLVQRGRGDSVVGELPLLSLVAWASSHVWVFSDLPSPGKWVEES